MTTTKAKPALKPIASEQFTLRLDEELARAIREECERTKRERSEVIRDILRREFAVRDFKRAQALIAPRFKAAGFKSEKQLLKAVS